MHKSSVDKAGSTDPLKSKPFVDPMKGKYEDPLKKTVVLVPLESTFKIPEYRPYKMPDFDPLTGKPWARRRRHIAEKPKEEPKKTKQLIKPNYYIPNVGSTVGSMKRTLRIQDNLNF